MTRTERPELRIARSSASWTAASLSASRALVACIPVRVAITDAKCIAAVEGHLRAPCLKIQASSSGCEDLPIVKRFCCATAAIV